MELEKVYTELITYSAEPISNKIFCDKLVYEAKRLGLGCDFLTIEKAIIDANSYGDVSIIFVYGGQFSPYHVKTDEIYSIDCELAYDTEEVRPTIINCILYTISEVRKHKISEAIQ